MPVWRPGCLRGSVYEPDKIQYRPATNGYPGPGDDGHEDRRGTTLVDLRKVEGSGLGLIIAGGIDKGIKPHISNLRPGGIAHRSDCLEVGDVILSVNGIRTYAMRHDEIINLLKNADENVRLEIEYDLPDIGPTDAFSVRCKQYSITIDPDGGTFGFVLRGGMCQDRLKCRPITVTQVRPGSPADREGSLKPGDRILAVNDFSIVSLSLTEMNMLLSQCLGETFFTVEYDISVIDAVQRALGPLLIEIDKTPGAALGITLSHARHKNKHCVCIDTIRPMSVADSFKSEEDEEVGIFQYIYSSTQFKPLSFVPDRRAMFKHFGSGFDVGCGALHVGDLILSIDGADVEHMTVAEATQLLKSTPGDQIKMEILPVRLVDQASREMVYLNAGFQKNIIPSISSPVLNTPAMFNGGIGSSKSFQALASAGRMSSEMINKRRKSWGKTDRKIGSCVSVASASTSIFTASNQVCRMDTQEVILYGERMGLGIVLDTANYTSLLEDPPVVKRLEPNTASDRCGTIQEGDRILNINGVDVRDKTLEEVNALLQDSWQHAKLEVEFDVADTVMASCGTFVVKLPRKAGGIGITLSGKTKIGNPFMITEVKKGSVAYRCGSVQPGDKLLSVNDIRTENLSMDEAVALLKGEDEIIKLKLKRDDPCTDANGDECISYTVELERHGGPLGITITGTDDPADPILISGLADGGLASRTGAIHIGDRLLAINGLVTFGKSLSEATSMLQSGGDIVTLKVARPDKSKMHHSNSSKSSSSREELGKSTTPVRSIDSALESWDSSGPDINANIYSGIQVVSKPNRPKSVTLPKVKERKRNPRPYSDDSTDTGDDFGKRLSELQISDDALEADHSSCSEDSSPDGAEDWSKAFKNFETQSNMLDQIENNIRQHSTGSLDRRMMRNTRVKERQKVRRNWSHSTSRSAISQSDLGPYTLDRKQRRCASSSSSRDIDNMPLHDQLKTVFSPQPIQLHRVTLQRECPGEDFGFGVSDGEFDRGVYISAVRTGSVADKMGLRQYDRILQINKTKTRDYDCTLAIPLISNSGGMLDIVVCRNPLTHKKTVLKALQKRKPPPEPPEEATSSGDNKDIQSVESSPVYMNVYNLDTPVARSEKSCKTV